MFDLRQNPSPLVSSADLRQLTGHTGIEDIEIRALWKDNLDNLIFAGSSWGNGGFRGPSLPSFFVLELVKEKMQTARHDARRVSAGCQDATVSSGVSPAYRRGSATGTS